MSLLFFFYPFSFYPQSPHCLSCSSHFLLISFLTFNHQFISFFGETSPTNEYVLPVTHTWAKLCEHTRSPHTKHLCSSFSPPSEQQDNTVILGSGSKTHSICLYLSLTVRLHLSLFLMSENTGIIHYSWWLLWIFVSLHLSLCFMSVRWSWMEEEENLGSVVDLHVCCFFLIKKC